MNYSISVLKRELYRLMDKWEELEQGRDELGNVPKLTINKGHDPLVQQRDHIARVMGKVGDRIKSIQDAISKLEDVKN